MLFRLREPICALYLLFHAFEKVAALLLRISMIQKTETRNTKRWFAESEEGSWEEKNYLRVFQKHF